MEERRMSSHRQINNQGNLGFFPTSLNIVDMEMDLVDWSELRNNSITINITDLTGGVGDQLDRMYNYLLNLNIYTACYYNELNVDRYNSCVSNYPYMSHLNSDANSIKLGAKINNSIDKKVFGIIRNNPPYGFDTSDSGFTTRLEKRFYDINANYDILGGIHFLEIPIHCADKDLLSIMDYKYEMKAFKFPKGEFEKFKQICIVMKKKKNPFRNKIAVENILLEIEEDRLIELDQVTSPVFKVSLNDFSKANPVYYFRNKSITDKTLSDGALQVWDEIIKFNTKKNRTNVILKEKPIIEQLQGHVASMLASGRYNGIMGDLLVTGGSNKIIKRDISIDEKGLETIIQTEMLKPFIELTNKKGDIVYKDF